jgi:SPP1 family predicted phage head-tail adaptor
MSTQIGELKERVTLLRPVEGDARVGQKLVNYVPYAANLPAKVEGLKTRDVPRFRQAQLRTEAIITIRYVSAVTVDWHVMLDGVEYHVEDVGQDKPRWTTLNVYRSKK